MADHGVNEDLAGLGTAELVTLYETKLGEVEEELLLAPMGDNFSLDDLLGNLPRVCGAITEVAVRPEVTRGKKGNAKVKRSVLESIEKLGTLLDVVALDNMGGTAGAARKIARIIFGFLGNLLTARAGSHSPLSLVKCCAIAVAGSGGLIDYKALAADGGIPQDVVDLIENTRLLIDQDTRRHLFPAAVRQAALGQFAQLSHDWRRDVRAAGFDVLDVAIANLTAVGPIGDFEIGSPQDGAIQGLAGILQAMPSAVVAERVMEVGTVLALATSLADISGGIALLVAAFEHMSEHLGARIGELLELMDKVHDKFAPDFPPLAVASPIVSFYSSCLASTGGVFVMNRLAHDTSSDHVHDIVLAVACRLLGYVEGLPSTGSTALFVLGEILTEYKLTADSFQSEVARMVVAFIDGNMEAATKPTTDVSSGGKDEATSVGVELLLLSMQLAKQAKAGVARLFPEDMPMRLLAFADARKDDDMLVAAIAARAALAISSESNPEALVDSAGPLTDILIAGVHQDPAETAAGGGGGGGEDRAWSAIGEAIGGLEMLALQYPEQTAARMADIVSAIVARVTPAVDVFDVMDGDAIGVTLSRAKDEASTSACQALAAMITQTEACTPFLGDIAEVALTVSANMNHLTDGCAGLFMLLAALYEATGPDGPARAVVAPETRGVIVASVVDAYGQALSAEVMDFASAALSKMAAVGFDDPDTVASILELSAMHLSDPNGGGDGSGSGDGGEDADGDLNPPDDVDGVMATGVVDVVEQVMTAAIKGGDEPEAGDPRGEAWDAMVEAVVGRLTSDSSVIRENVVHCLAMMCECLSVARLSAYWSRMWEPVLVMLKDEDSVARRSAAYTLGVLLSRLYAASVDGVALDVLERTAMELALIVDDDEVAGVAENAAAGLARIVGAVCERMGSSDEASTAAAKEMVATFLPATVAIFPTIADPGENATVVRMLSKVFVATPHLLVDAADPGLLWEAVASIQLKDGASDGDPIGTAAGGGGPGWLARADAVADALAEHILVEDDDLLSGCS